jgi:hypothetical protein
VTDWATISSLATAGGTLVLAVELLYGDHEGGQRMITRFGLIPISAEDGRRRWLAVAARHWNLDRDEPR